MILLGLLLMAACAALAVDAVVENHGAIHAVAFNQPISHLSLGAIFVAGAVVGLLFALGLRLGANLAVERQRRREPGGSLQGLHQHGWTEPDDPGGYGAGTSLDQSVQFLDTRGELQALRAGGRQAVIG